MVCKPGEFILKNFISDCKCKFGFAGDLCETPRMMCILGGEETDGSICDCSIDGGVNLKQNDRGCCANGMYWDQIRYSSFSPLTEFAEIPDNVFYTDQLMSVCKPLHRKHFQIYGETDEKLALLSHNYVATNTDHEIEESVPCDGDEKEVPLYRYEFKYTSMALDSAYTTYMHAPASNTLFSDHNAKIFCMDRCTVNTEPGEPVFKSFILELLCLVQSHNQSGLRKSKNFISW